MLKICLWIKIRHFFSILMHHFLPTMLCTRWQKSQYEVISRFPCDVALIHSALKRSSCKAQTFLLKPPWIPFCNVRWVTLKPTEIPHQPTNRHQNCVTSITLSKNIQHASGLTNLCLIKCDLSTEKFWLATFLCLLPSRSVRSWYFR